MTSAEMLGAVGGGEQIAITASGDVVRIDGLVVGKVDQIHVGKPRSALPLPGNPAVLTYPKGPLKFAVEMTCYENANPLVESEPGPSEKPKPPKGGGRS